MFSKLSLLTRPVARQTLSVARSAVSKCTNTAAFVASRSFVRAGSTFAREHQTAGANWTRLRMLAAGGCFVVAGGLLYQSQSFSAQADAATGLSPDKFNKLKLQEIFDYNHNTKVFRFALASEDAQFDIPITRFILTKITVDGKEVIRPYTPIATGTGFFDLMIKAYPGGPMSQHIHAMKPGDDLEIKGPLPKLKYEPNMKKHIGMIAGGTGLTPMLQVISRIISNENDKTDMTLIFGNVTEEDILLRESLDEMVAAHPNFHVHYLLDKPSKDWKGDSGYVTKELAKKYLPPPSNDNLILVCGPPGLMKTVSGPKAPDYTQGDLDGILKELGYTKDQVFKF